MSLHKTQKYILKKHKTVFFSIAISHASYLLSVRDVISCHQRGGRGWGGGMLWLHPYLHLISYSVNATTATTPLLPKRKKKQTSETWWRLGLNYAHFQVKTLARHISSHSVHQYEIKNYQQINKKQNHPKHYPCHILKTNTRTGPHLLVWFLQVSHAMRKLQLSATNFFFFFFFSEDIQVRDWKKKKS